MNVLVTYTSLTGNTKKVAQAIFEAIDVNKKIEELAKVTDLAPYDLVFVGFPIHLHEQPPAETIDFLRTQCKDKTIALFITHGAIEDFPDMPHWIENCRKAAQGAKVIGLFHCQGQVAKEMIERMLKSPDPKIQDYAKRVGFVQGQPDASRLAKAQAFARDMLAKVRVR